MGEKMSKEKIFVDVRFSEKEKAKQAGAKWDWVHKSWYFEGSVPPQYLNQKSNKSIEERLNEAKKKHEERKSTFTSKSSGFVTGRNFNIVEGCDNCCPPWEVCSKPCPNAIGNQ
jgi:hypothetical protein